MYPAFIFSWKKLQHPPHNRAGDTAVKKRKNKKLANSPPCSVHICIRHDLWGLGRARHPTYLPPTVPTQWCKTLPSNNELLELLEMHYFTNVILSLVLTTQYIQEHTHSLTYLSMPTPDLSIKEQSTSEFTADSFCLPVVKPKEGAKRSRAAPRLTQCVDSLFLVRFFQRLH